MKNGAPTDRLTDEQLEALLEVVFTVCFADDDFGAEEQRRFRERVRQLEDDRVHSERVDGLMLRAAMQLTKDGRDARLRHAGRILADDTAKRVALALAIEIAGADGLDGEERASIDAVASAFGIPPDQVQAMLPRA